MLVLPDIVQVCIIKHKIVHVVNYCKAHVWPKAGTNDVLEMHWLQQNVDCTNEDTKSLTHKSLTYSSSAATVLFIHEIIGV